MKALDYKKLKYINRTTSLKFTSFIKRHPAKLNCVLIWDAFLLCIFTIFFIDLSFVSI